jgi:hypothetical protein
MTMARGVKNRQVLAPLAQRFRERAKSADDKSARNRFRLSKALHKKTKKTKI